MKEKFELLIDEVKRLHDELVRMMPVTKRNLGQCDFPGVYLFTEDGIDLYVGRTERHLKERLPEHWTVKDAPLAFRLARIATGNREASYRADENSRKKLIGNSVFARAFMEQKKRIARMSIRYVRVDDPTTQALLEIYSATVLKTLHNRFSTS